MFGHRVKIDRALYQRIERHAATAGVSVEAFVRQALEIELGRIEEAEAESMEQVKVRLKGLGYL